MSRRYRDRDRSYSPSPRRHRRARSRSRSRDRPYSRRRHSSSESDSDRHHKYSSRSHRRRQSSSSDSNLSDSRHGNSSGRSRRRRRSRSRSPHKKSRKKERRRERSRSREERRSSKDKRRRSRSAEGKRSRRERSSSKSRSRERTEVKVTTMEKRAEDTGRSSSEGMGEASAMTPAERLRSKVKALLQKATTVETESSETSQSHDQLAPPTPGQLAIIESNSFVADKFVSNRKSRKWDVPPPGVSLKPSAAASSADSGVVDPSEYAPKVVPLCEVEGALERGGEEGGEGVREEKEENMTAGEKDKYSSELVTVDKNQRWLQKLQRMRQKFPTPPTD